jgi:hypothetical protein
MAIEDAEGVVQSRELTVTEAILIILRKNKLSRKIGNTATLQNLIKIMRCPDQQEINMEGRAHF